MAETITAPPWEDFRPPWEDFRQGEEKLTKQEELERIQEETAPEVSVHKPSLWEQFRESATGRGLMGPTPAEKAGGAQGFGLLNIPETMFQLTTPPPVVTQPIESGVKKATEAILPPSVAGAVQGAVGFGLGMASPALPLVPWAKLGRPAKIAGAASVIAPHLVGLPEAKQQFQAARKAGETGTAAKILTEQILGGELSLAAGLGAFVKLPKSLAEAEKTVKQTTTERPENAPQERQIEESVQRERERVEAQRLPPETGIGDSLQPAAPIQPETPPQDAEGRQARVLLEPTTEKAAAPAPVVSEQEPTRVAAAAAATEPSGPGGAVSAAPPAASVSEATTTQQVKQASVSMEDIKQMRSSYRNTSTGEVFVSSGVGEGHSRFAERLGISDKFLKRNPDESKGYKGPWTIPGYEYGLTDSKGRFYTIDELDKALQLPAGGETKGAEATAQPELVGLGAAATGEVSTGSGADIYGIAERVRQERAKAGQVVPVPRGKGIDAPDSVERGRLLIQQGADPQKALTDFEATKKLSADDMAVTRAHGEELALAARRIEEQFGTASPEYLMAWRSLSDWDTRTKPMQTEWHKMGVAQQGETDIDTGSFTGLQRAYKDATGNDFTPAQATTATRIAKGVKIAANASEAARQSLYNQLELGLQGIDVPMPKNLDEARMLFAKYQSGTGFTPQQVKTLWNAARKFYLDAGITDFDDIRNGLATDFGLSVNDVTKALDQPKGTRVLTDDMWRKQQNARRLSQQARQWLKAVDTPGYRKAINAVPRTLFSLKVGFHGTVALGTHAPTVAFQPRFWNVYAKDFVKMYRMVGSSAYYERQVQDLLRRPNYITARRAGLVNDPFLYEEYQVPAIQNFVAKMLGPMAEKIDAVTHMGNRGYAVLKMLRQDMFDQMWDQLPQTAKVPEMAASIADGLNHVTGVVKGKAPPGTNIALFAPRLEASRVMWLAGDPIRAANTFLQWGKATPAEKAFAVNQVKEKAWVAGTLFTMLSLNQGMLTATGSDQKINFDDPFRSDFLKFKAAGMDIGYGNAMLSMMRLPVRLYRIRSSSGGKLRNLIYPDEDTYTVLGQYARSQLSPFASLATELWLKADYQNRPLPSSDRPVPKRLRAEGVAPYTWPEFWSEQLTPIPVQEALKEVWTTGLGATPEQRKQLYKAMATIAVMGATGSRFTEDTTIPR